MSEPYIVRVHPRARHVRLRVDARAGLIVTVPPRFDQARIPGLVAERREWIDAVRRRQAGQRSRCAPSLLGTRPQRVELAALNRAWGVDYRSVAGYRARLDEGEQDLLVSLPALPEDQADQRAAQLLRAWLAARAREHLGGQLAALASHHGLSYRAMSIRHQRSRWGSCSASGRISLNARLMFCPPETVRYVLIHELAHTEHLDHSPAFWARVAELMPDHELARRALNRVWQQLPDWA